MFQYWIPVYDNTVQAFVPEFWAMESLMILTENMVAGGLVYRDFEPQIARFGDTVNTRLRADFTAHRKTNADSVTVQDANATNIPVVLNQHIHTSFMIKDGEESKSFKDLVTEFLEPAVIAQAHFIDTLVLGQYAQFLGNSYGNVGNLTTGNAKANILGVRETLNVNKCPMEGRNLVLNPVSEATLLNLDIFTQAQQVGDQGQALREATLGRKLGFDMWLDQNMATVIPNAQPTTSDTLSHTGGYPIGAKSFVLATGTSPDLVAGTWFTISGDMTPLQIATWTSGSKTITTTTGLKSPVVNGAAVTLYSSGAVNQAVSPAGYVAGYSKDIAYDVISTPLQVGQFISFSGDANIYTIIQTPTTSTFVLDRPLVLALTDDQVILPGPVGAYNFAFHRNALALVVRPLAPPKAGTGALSSVANYKDLSMRATITYDGNKQGHLVTLDMLAGIAILDTRLGAVLLG